MGDRLGGWGYTGAAHPGPQRRIMASSIIRGKHVITRVIDDNASEIIDDGAVYQEDGAIVEVGGFEDLSARYSPDEVVGDGSHLVIPGLVNAITTWV